MNQIAVMLAALTLLQSLPTAFAQAPDEVLLKFELTFVQNQSVQTPYDTSLIGAINTANISVDRFRATNLPANVDISCSVHVADIGDLPAQSIRNWIGRPGKAIQAISCTSPNGKLLYSTGTKYDGWATPIPSGLSGTKGKNRPLAAIALRFSYSGNFTPTIPCQDAGVTGIAETAKCSWSIGSSWYIKGEQKRVSTMFWSRSPFCPRIMNPGPLQRIKTAGNKSCPTQQRELLQLKFDRCSDSSILNVTPDTRGVLLSGSVTSRPGACSESISVSAVGLGQILVPGFRFMDRDKDRPNFDEPSTNDPEVDAWIQEASTQPDYPAWLSANVRNTELGVGLRVALINALFALDTQEGAAILRELSETDEDPLIRDAAAPLQ